MLTPTLPETSCLRDLGAGLLAFVLTSAPVWLGVWFGIDFVAGAREDAGSSRLDFLAACTRSDARHYADILEHGYSYDPVRRSTVAFFPVYPLAGRLAAQGWDTRWALLLVSNVMLLGAFVALSAYLRSRWPDSASKDRYLVLALFGVWPAGFFFRMPYSESTFLFFTLLVLYGIARRWPLPLVAGLSGLATAARPVGLAVAAALAWRILRDPDGDSRLRRSLRTAILLPLALWGLIAYMGYQWYAFGTPLAFVQTQEHWSFGPQSVDLVDKAGSLLSGEPIWSVYAGGPARPTWKHIDRHGNPFFSMFFWNPIFFVGAVALVLFGAYKSWLTGPEIVLGFGLLAIPYLTRAREMSMASHARFAAVVIPTYLVLGRILRSQPEWLIWLALGGCSLLLMGWSALFAAGYYLF